MIVLGFHIPYDCKIRTTQILGSRTEPKVQDKLVAQEGILQFLIVSETNKTSRQRQKSHQAPKVQIILNS